MAVESISKVKAYGNKVANLAKPADADDYTVETFITNMQSEKAYVVYNNDSADNYTTTTTVAKIGLVNPDYAVKVETRQSGGGDFISFTKEYEPVSAWETLFLCLGAAVVLGAATAITVFLVKNKKQKAAK